MTDSPTRPMNRSDRFSGLLIGFGTAALTIVIGLAVIGTPSVPSDTAAAVRDRLDESGVSNPVTAVLLNFRAYDTLLEITVLVMALVATWALGQPSGQRPPSAGPVLAKAMRWFAPAMVLIAGYLLWRGAFAPGGAFQAGAILATVGVLYLVIGELRLSPALWLRASVVFGVLVFLGMGLLFALLADGFLVYPAGQAKTLILVIETASALSIGVILAALFLGGQPAGRSEP